MNSRASGAQTGHFEIGSDNTCLREEIGRLRVRTRELEARLRQMNEVCAKEQAGGQAKYQNELADTQEDNAKALAATKAKHAKAINAIREPSQNAHPTPAERFGEATSSKLARIIRMCEDLEKVLSDKSASLTAPESEIHEDHRNVVASTPASNMAKSPVVNQISESMNANTFPDIPAIEVAGKAWTKAKGSRNNSAEASHEPQSDSSRLTQSQKYALANVSMTDAEPAELQHKLQAAVVPSPHYISSRISKSSIVPAKPVSHDERMKQRGKELRSAWYEKNAGTNVTTPRAFREESRRATGPSAAESDQSDSGMCHMYLVYGNKQANILADSEMTEDTSSSGGEVGDEVLNEDMLDLVQAMGRLSLG